MDLARELYIYIYIYLFVCLRKRKTHEFILVFPIQMKDHRVLLLIFVFLFICIRNLVPSNVSIDTYML